MYLFKRIAISNRELCPRSLPDQVRKLMGKVDFFLLREKDLSEEEYKDLAAEVQGACRKSGIVLICHTFVTAARWIGCEAIHLPFSTFMERKDDLYEFRIQGVSIHTLEEGVAAQEAGADYVTYSPIFQTECKPGVPAKGIDDLRRVCRRLQIPVWALGGITTDNEHLAKQAGAAGACRMSDFMK